MTSESFNRAVGTYRRLAAGIVGFMVLGLTFVMVSIVTGLPFSLLYHVDMFYLAMLSALIALGVVSVGMFAWMAGEPK